MMMKLIKLGFWMGAMVMLMAALPAHADTEWHHRGAGVTSAGLANLNAMFLGVAGLSWPDGRQSIITMWRREGNAHDTGDPFRVTYRCIDFFDAAMQPTGGKCELAEWPGR